MELHFGGDPAKKMKERSLQPQPVLYGKAKTAEMLSFWGKESFKEGVGISHAIFGGCRDSTLYPIVM